MFNNSLNIQNPNNKYYEEIVVTLVNFWIDCWQTAEMVSELARIIDKQTSDYINNYAQAFTEIYRKKLNTISTDLWPHSKTIINQILVGLKTFDIWRANINKWTNQIDNRDMSSLVSKVKITKYKIFNRKLSNDMNSQIRDSMLTLISALGISETRFEKYIETAQSQTPRD